MPCWCAIRRRSAHDRERSEALVQIDAVIQAAKKRLGELAEERKRIDDELEFYKKDPSKAPDSLLRKVEDNARERGGAKPLHR